MITGLETGGAETALSRLVPGLAAEGFEQRVVCMLRPGPLAAPIESAGVAVESLGMERGLPTPRALWRLVRILRSFSPHIVQTWLYHADFLGLLGVSLARVGTLVWNIRCADMDLSRYRRTTAWTVAACARLSRLPAAVIANSEAAREHHVRLGYRPRRFEIIPNGFDLDAMRPVPGAREALRQQIGAPEDARLVGMAARFDPMKGHEVFLAAVGELVRQRGDVRFVLCGDGVDEENAALAGLIGRVGLQGRVALLGRVADMAAFHSGLDVAVLSSHSESLPNAVGEAMACGVPCVVSDVGDARALVGETGIVVPRGDASSLVRAMADMLSLPESERSERGLRARERIAERYSLRVATARQASLYRELVG
nr:glycosyltransferase [Desulfobaculum xiamenense]